MTEDAAGNQAGTPPPTADEAVRLARRRFFRAFVSDAMKTAASVVGVAGALQRTSAEMAGTLLGAAAEPREETVPAPGPPDFNGGAGAAQAPAAPAAPAATFRSPFRLETDSIILLDQRRLPDELVEVSCQSAADVRVAILEGVVRGAPLLGQVTAAALAVAAAGAADSRPYARRAILKGTSNALHNAAGSAAPVRQAIARMGAIIDRRSDLFDDGPGLAAVLRAEAEAIIGEATLDLAALGGHGATLFAGAPEGSKALSVLTLGSVGALAGGQLGTVLAVLNRAIADGASIEVTVCETRPALTGTRLTGWELEQAGIPYTIIPDAGAGALIAKDEIDVVIVGAEAIAANGDSFAEAGTHALALLAWRHDIPFVVAAPGVTIDLEAVDGRRFVVEPRPVHDVLAVQGRRFAPPGASARNPGLDLTPGELVGAIVTEGGLFEPPLADGLAQVAAAVRARWSIPLDPPVSETSELSESAQSTPPAEPSVVEGSVVQGSSAGGSAVLEGGVA